MPNGERKNGDLRWVRDWLPVLIVAGAVISQWAVYGQRLAAHEQSYAHSGMATDFLSVRESLVEMRTNQNYLRNDLLDMKKDLRALNDKVTENSIK